MTEPSDAPVLRKRVLDLVSHPTRMSRLKNYTIYLKLGQGTFGVVQKAKAPLGELVALKQLLNHSAKEGFPITAMREITILKQLDHVNILKIVDMIYDDPQVANPADLITTRGCFYTVLPYMALDLVGLLENPRVVLEVPHIKCIMHQLLQGVNYIHQQRFLHRDIKAANILLAGDGVLKIADFGLARTYHGKPPREGSPPGGGERLYTGLVVTRWYRAPELLLGERKYTTAVDMWGVGCVFAELFTHKPILVGKTDAHQAQLVFQLCGLPLEWPAAMLLPNKTDYNLGLTAKRSFETRFSELMPPEAVALLARMLTLDPYKRANAADAMRDPFFAEGLLDPHELPKFEECHEIDKERFKRMGRGTNGRPKFNPVGVPSGPSSTSAAPSGPAVTSYKPLNPTRPAMEVPRMPRGTSATPTGPAALTPKGPAALTPTGPALTKTPNGSLTKLLAMAAAAATSAKASPLPKPAPSAALVAAASSVFMKRKRPAPPSETSKRAKTSTPEESRGQ